MSRYWKSHSVPEPNEQTMKFYLIMLMVPLIFLIAVIAATFPGVEVWGWLKENSGVLAALGTIFIALSSLYVSLRSLAFSEKQRQHNEYSLKPQLHITRTHPAPKERNVHGLHLRNFGTGPAQNITYEFELDGIKYEDPKTFIETFKQKFMDGWSWEDAKLIGGYFVPALFPNQSERFLWLYPEDDVTWPVGNPENKKEIVDKFERLLKTTKVRISYRSPYQEDLHVTYPKEVCEQDD